MARHRLPNIEFFQDHMGRKLDIRRTGCAGHRPADRLVHDLVGLVGIFDELLYLTEGVKRPSCRTNWIRPRRTRRSVIRARWPPRKITGEFSTSAHIIAPEILATPGPSVPMHKPGLPVIRDAASAMNPALNSWCGATTDQPRRPLR